MENKQEINIWYICGLSLCNFNCSYCASGLPSEGGKRTSDREWSTNEDQERFNKVLEWIARQPFSIGIRLQTIGEPMVSRSFLKQVAQLSECSNIRFIELVTNGSLISKRLPNLLYKYGILADKLSLWITFHHTEISVDDLMEQVMFAHNKGLKVIVNSLLFPDNAHLVMKLSSLCNDNGIKFHADLGHNYNNSYPGTQYFAVAEDKNATVLTSLNIDSQIKKTAIIASNKPNGFLCSAGHDYIFISSEGDVYPCRPYYKDTIKKLLGSALDESFILQLREREYARCAVTHAKCTCKEDYLHMQIARSTLTDPRSLGIGYVGEIDSAEKTLMKQVLDEFDRNELIAVLETV